MKPECRGVLAKISTYLDGELDEATCTAIDQHCATCASCAAVVADLKQTAGLCRRVGATPLPSSVRERARERVRRLLEEPSDGERAAD